MASVRNRCLQAFSIYIPSWASQGTVSGDSSGTRRRPWSRNEGLKLKVSGSISMDGEWLLRALDWSMVFAHNRSISIYAVPVYEVNFKSRGFQTRHSTQGSIMTVLHATRPSIVCLGGQRKHTEVHWCANVTWTLTKQYRMAIVFHCSPTYKTPTKCADIDKSMWMVMIIDLSYPCSIKREDHVQVWGIQGWTTTRILHGLEDLRLLEVLDYTSASLLRGKKMSVEHPERSTVP